MVLFILVTTGVRTSNPTTLYFLTLRQDFAYIIYMKRWERMSEGGGRGVGDGGNLQ
jgi:hypothetical protein